MQTGKPHGVIKNLLDQAAKQTGAETSESSSVVCVSRVFPNKDEAETSFVRLRARLFLIDHWNACSNISSFYLFDKNGIARQDAAAAVSDFIRISLPGSGKDDWVNLIEISDQPDEIVLTVRPSHDPTDEAKTDATAHFFTQDSTNNFCLERNGAQLNFYVIGLDEKTNTEETEGILGTIRNYATANLGCFFGVQKKQWEMFGRNFLEETTGEK